MTTLLRVNILEALDIHEAIALSTLSEKRDTKHQKRIQHEDAWKHRKDVYDE